MTQTRAPERGDDRRAGLTTDDRDSRLSHRTLSALHNLAHPLGFGKLGA